MLVTGWWENQRSRERGQGTWGCSGELYGSYLPRNRKEFPYFDNQYDCTSLYQLDFPIGSNIACAAASVMLPKTTMAVDLPARVGTEDHLWYLSHHDTLSYEDGHALLGTVELNRKSYCSGGRGYWRKWVKEESFGYQSLIPAEISAEI